MYAEFVNNNHKNVHVKKVYVQQLEIVIVTKLTAATLSLYLV